MVQAVTTRLVLVVASQSRQRCGRPAACDRDRTNVAQVPRALRMPRRNVAISHRNSKRRPLRMSVLGGPTGGRLPLFGGAELEKPEAARSLASDAGQNLQRERPARRSRHLPTLPLPGISYLELPHSADVSFRAIRTRSRAACPAPGPYLQALKPPANLKIGCDSCKWRLHRRRERPPFRPQIVSICAAVLGRQIAIRGQHAEVDE
jgi:hypothetical protein